MIGGVEQGIHPGPMDCTSNGAAPRCPRAGQGEESMTSRRHQAPDCRSRDVPGPEEPSLMLALLLLSLAEAPPPGSPAPLSIVIQSSRGESRIPVQLDALASPVLPAPAVLTALGASAVRGDGWAGLRAEARFRFMLGEPSPPRSRPGPRGCASGTTRQLRFHPGPVRGAPRSLGIVTVRRAR